MQSCVVKYEFINTITFLWQQFVFKVAFHCGVKCIPKIKFLSFTRYGSADAEPFYKVGGKRLQLLI